MDEKTETLLRFTRMELQSAIATIDNAINILNRRRNSMVKLLEAITKEIEGNGTANHD